MKPPLRCPLLTLLLSASLVLGACRSSKPTATPSTPTAPASTATPVSVMSLPMPSGDAAAAKVTKTGCPITQAPAVAASARLTLGPSAGLTPTTAQGETLIIVGTVYDAQCAPVAGASLNVWQTDANGDYGPSTSASSLECCYLQGEVKTDDNGHYQLTTVRPGYYQNTTASVPPAHIHVEVRHPQAGSLMTEIVFADDEKVRGGNPGFVVIALTTMAGPEGRHTFLHGVADLVLSEGSTSAPTPVRLGQSQTYALVPEQSTAAYQIREQFAILPVTTTALAVTPLVEGRLQFTLNDPPTLQTLTMTVDLRGLTSDDVNRDNKLADRWLVTDQFPLAYFTATALQGAPDRYTDGQAVTFTLLGDLTIRDITRPATFEVTAKLNGATLTGSAVGAVKMTDFDIDPPNLLNFVVVEDEVVVTVNFTARQVDDVP